MVSELVIKIVSGLSSVMIISKSSRFNITKLISIYVEYFQIA